MKLNKSGVVCILSCVDKTQGGKYGHADIQADPTRDAEISPPDKRESYHNLDAEERGQVGNVHCRPDRLLGFDHLARAGTEQGQERIPAQEGPGHGPAPHRREGRKAARRNPSSRAGLAFCAHQAKPSAEARFTGLTENCYTTNQSQESTCLTMLRNEGCVGCWKAGKENLVRQKHLQYC